MSEVQRDQVQATLARLEEKVDLIIEALQKLEIVETEEPDPIAAAFNEMHARKRARN